MSPPDVMILAAGLGRRLAPWTLQTPKPLLPLFDVPLIELTLRRLIRAGCHRVVINSCHLYESLETAVQELAGSLQKICRQQTGHPLTVRISRESELLGTGGGIAQAVKWFEGRSVLVVNSDVLCSFPLRRLWDYHRSTEAAATVLLHGGTGCEHLRSTATDSAGRITAIDRTSKRYKERGVFTGIYLLEPEIYTELAPVFSSVITAGLRPAMQKGQLVQGLTEDFPWCDLGTWDDYLGAVISILRDPSVAPFQEAIELSPGRFRQDRESSTWSYFGPELKLDPRLEPGPLVSLGAGAEIEFPAQLRQSIVMPGVHVSGECINTVRY